MKSDPKISADARQGSRRQNSACILVAMPAKLGSPRQCHFQGLLGWDGGTSPWPNARKSGSEVSSNGRNIRITIPLELPTVDAGRDLYLRRVAKRSAAYRIDRTVRGLPRFQRPAGALRRTDASGAALPAAADRSSAEFGARHDGGRPGILARQPHASPSTARRDKRSGGGSRNDARVSETARFQASPVGAAHVPKPGRKSLGAAVEGAS